MNTKFTENLSKGMRDYAMAMLAEDAIDNDLDSANFRPEQYAPTDAHKMVYKEFVVGFDEQKKEPILERLLFFYDPTNCFKRRTIKKTRSAHSDLVSVEDTFKFWYWCDSHHTLTIESIRPNPATLEIFHENPSALAAYDHQRCLFWQAVDTLHKKWHEANDLRYLRVENKVYYEAKLKEAQENNLLDSDGEPTNTVFTRRTVEYLAERGINTIEQVVNHSPEDQGKDNPDAIIIQGDRSKFKELHKELTQYMVNMAKEDRKKVEQQILVSEQELSDPKATIQALKRKALELEGQVKMQNYTQGGATPKPNTPPPEDQVQNIPASEFKTNQTHDIRTPHQEEVVTGPTPLVPNTNQNQNQKDDSKK